METKNPKQAINYGFVPPTIEKEHYVFGAATLLPRIILQPTAQWDAFLPQYEPQFGPGWDSYGCGIWGTENAFEFLWHRVLGVIKNFSERFTYNMTHTRPPGSDPHVIAESIRNDGMIDNDLLPFTETFEEFITPDPMTNNLILTGQALARRYFMGNEWVFQGDHSKEDKVARMKECLQYSPLGVSVSAWFEDEDGVYVDDGAPNNHWCCCYGFTDKGWKIFDSYDHSQKIYSFEAEISFCKRYYIEAKVVPAPRLGFFQSIFSLLKRLCQGKLKSR